MKTNWMTDSLEKEVSSLLPTKDDIIDQENGKRSLDSWTLACEKLLPEGRIFASSFQLSQCLKKFLPQWACHPSNKGKSITCGHSKRVERKRNSQKKSNKINDTPSNTECPFEVRWSYVKYPKKNPLPGAFYKVKITKLNTNHTCGLATKSHRRAILGSGEIVKVPLKHMQFISKIIKERPSITTSQLRPYLNEYVPHFKCVDADMCKSLKRRVLNYYNTNGWNAELDAQSSLDIIKQKGAAYEHLKSDDPLICKNVAVMFRKIMSETSVVWRAEKFAEIMKQTMAGFDYKIRYDRDGEPDAILWMTHYNRTVLKRYPKILSLDMQKVQYNRYNWPYCSLIFYGGENRGEQGCECIVCEESIEMYHWIISSCVELEPGFDLSRIRVIFADNLITEDLLHRLRIKKTCFLHCDYYHQMLVVWPAYFQNQFSKVQHYLQTIINSKTEDQFLIGLDELHKIISTFDKGKADHFVNDMKTRASYYAGYHLEKVTGIMNLKGSQESEQNHSGNHAYLGPGDHLEIENEMKALLERQQNRIRSWDEKKCKWDQLAYRYNAKCFIGVMKISDKNARDSLNQWAFKELWTKEAKASLSYLTKKETDGSTVIWHNSKKKYDAATLRIVLNGTRCDCSFRRRYWCQCRHEIRIDGKFLIEKWADRFYNDDTYATKVHSLTAADYDKSNGKSISDENEFNNDKISDLYDEDDDDHSANKSDLGNMYIRTKQRCEEMCRLLQNDDVELCKFKSHVDQMITQMRAGNKITYYMSIDSIGSKPSNGIKPSCTRTNKAAYCQVRKKPFSEAIRVNKNKPTTKNSSLTRKGCLLCGTKGHTRKTCPLVINSLTKFNQFEPLSNYEKQQFGTKLTSDIHFKCKHLTDVPESIYHTYNQKIGALCIHEKYKCDNKVYLKCSVFREHEPNGPALNEEYFSLQIVCKMITKNAQTVVFSELEENVMLSQENANDYNAEIENEAFHSVMPRHNRLELTTRQPSLTTAHFGLTSPNNNILHSSSNSFNNYLYGTAGYPNTYANIPVNKNTVSHSTGLDTLYGGEEFGREEDI